MKKFILISIFMLCAMPAAAGENPFFGEYQNQISINPGHGTSAQWLLPFPGDRAHFSMFDFKYSQPNTFFRLPGRQNINVAYVHGWRDDNNWNWTDISVPIFYLSQDVSLYHTDNWYHGTGMGIGMQLQENERVGTKLIFSFKVFSGRRLTDQWKMEFFMQHFSNGSTSENNRSYNFWGVGFAYNF